MSDALRQADLIKELVTRCQFALRGALGAYGSRTGDLGYYHILIDGLYHPSEGGSVEVYKASIKVFGFYRDIDIADDLGQQLVYDDSWFFHDSISPQQLLADFRRLMVLEDLADV